MRFLAGLRFGFDFGFLGMGEVWHGWGTVSRSLKIKMSHYRKSGQPGVAVR